MFPFDTSHRPSLLPYLATASAAFFFVVLISVDYAFCFVMFCFFLLGVKGGCRELEWKITLSSNWGTFLEFCPIPWKNTLFFYVEGSILISQEMHFLSHYESYAGIFLRSSQWEPGEVAGGKAHESGLSA